MNLGALRQELAAQHVTLSVSAAGRLKYDAPGPLRASLVDAMREHKTALLEGLQKHQKTPNIDPLPAHLAALLESAHTGQLPHGAVKLASGLVTDLAGYVVSWAECWPRDRAHVLRRLEEAHAAVNTRMPGAEALPRLERPA